ncbi:hypothetical protein [Bacteroides sedimenti]
MKRHMAILSLLLLTTFVFGQSKSSFNPTKPNDIMVAVINNPNATAYDFASQLSLNKSNTSLFSYDFYKTRDLIKKRFTVNRVFNINEYTKFYNRASSVYSKLPNDASDFNNKFPDEVIYSPFDVTRPKGSKTFDVDVEYMNKKR